MTTHHGDIAIIGEGTGATTLAVGHGACVEARSVIVAVGGHPQVPAALDPIRTLVHTHETILEIEDLPETLAVIGAGPLGLGLGLELAQRPGGDPSGG